MADDKTPAEAPVEEPKEAKDSKAANQEEKQPAEATKTVRRKKSKRTVSTGQVHIQATFNNTIITFTDSKGGALVASSAGACGFRGSKKGTAYAAQIAGETAANAVKSQYGMSKAEVFVSGVGLGRDAAIRALSNVDIHVTAISDVTGIPHGGVRPKRVRRT